MEGGIESLVEIIREKQDMIKVIRGYPSTIRKCFIEIHIGALNKELLKQ
jgi:hypothetical protein